jgi:Family of unknown function (DUF5763)
MQTCRAKTNSGNGCRARARVDGYCHFHGNPNAARELGAKGGKGNRRRVLEPIEIPDDISIVELRGKTLQVMQLALSGEINSHGAIAFTQLSRQYERLSGIAEQLARLEILEQQVAELSNANSIEPKPTPERRLQELKLEAGEGSGEDGACDPAEPERLSMAKRSKLDS